MLVIIGNITSQHDDCYVSGRDQNYSAVEIFPLLDCIEIMHVVVG